MTERKPVDMTIESWVDRQVRVAAERGDFDDLPGAGKPIPPSTDDDDMGWIRRKLESEGLTTDVLLPLSLQLRREVEQVPRALARIDPRTSGAENEARAHVAELNRRIATWLRSPSPPVVPLSPVDAERALAHWRAGAVAGVSGADRKGAERKDAERTAVSRQVSAQPHTPGDPTRIVPTTEADEGEGSEPVRKTRDEVIVYWRPGCPFCQRLRTVLWAKRLRPKMINIWKDAEAAAFVRSVADGNETVPTVVIDGVAHVNPAPKRVVEALRRT